MTDLSALATGGAKAAMRGGVILEVTFAADDLNGLLGVSARGRPTPARHEGIEIM